VFIIYLFNSPVMEYKTPILEVLLSPTEIIKLILTTCLHVGMYGILI